MAAGTNRPGTPEHDLNERLAKTHSFQTILFNSRSIHR